MHHAAYVACATHVEGSPRSESMQRRGDSHSPFCEEAHHHGLVSKPLSLRSRRTAAKQSIHEAGRAESASQHEVSVVAAFCQSIVTLVCQQFCQAARLFCQAAREQTIWNASATRVALRHKCCNQSICVAVG
mmetsp:Transcript_27447/g.44031  ORF Transcript_27447/g.44031 Transcript_27447/m.44031 type:complete len:132 (+) Transcript_27447:331-726(+)